MFAEVKKKLLENPEVIQDILNHYGFAHITIKHTEIRCGIDEYSNNTSIQIRLQNNDNLWVTDYARNKNHAGDLFQYIIQTRKVDFKDVISIVKTTLGIENLNFIDRQQKIFGGFYDNIHKKQDYATSKTYDENLMNEFIIGYSQAFAYDNINLLTQKHFGIKYDPLTQRFVFPIRDIWGNLIGIKGRTSISDTENVPKYMSLVDCKISSTLFGYSENYEFLRENTIYVFEAEKSVMQAYSYGIRNCVALGCNSLSPTQAKILTELQPTRVVFMLDEGLDFEVTKQNIEQIRGYSKVFDFSIAYWDYTLDKNIPSKSSPTDLGKSKFMEIEKEQVINVD